MITIYTSPSCSSCKKVKKWFDEQHIPYKEKNIFSSVLNPEELKDILSKTENGTEDIISTRSNIIKSGNVQIDDMSVNELIDFIKKKTRNLRVIFLKCLRNPLHEFVYFLDYLRTRFRFRYRFFEVEF